jgi:hypothetical protein
MRKSLIILTETSANENHSRINCENLQQLSNLKRKRRLTSSLELLESRGLVGDAAIFVLSLVKIENQGGLR